MLSKITGIVLAIFILFLSLTNLTYAQSWTQLSPTGSTLTGRWGNTSVYDNNNQMIIFGGFGNAGGYPFIFNDIWVLSYANGLGGTSSWTPLAPTGSIPTTRQFHSAVYDKNHNRMIIFGGSSENIDFELSTTYLNDVWVLSNANGLDTSTSPWIQLSPNPDPTQTTNGYGGLPAPRGSHSAIMMR